MKYNKKLIIIGLFTFAFHLKSYGTEAEREEKTEEIAIIGTGFAGSTAAYYLARKDKVKSKVVHVFDVRSQMGGITQTFFHESGIGLEPGGCFVDSTHTAMLDLLRTLEIDIVDRYDRGRPRPSMHLLTGKPTFPADNTTSHEKELKNLSKEFGKSDLESKSIADIVKAAGISKSHPFSGLIDVGTQGEFGFDTKDVKASQYRDFMTIAAKRFEIGASGDERYFIKGGTHSVFAKIKKYLEKKNVQIHLEHLLTKVSRTPEGRFLLKFSTQNGKVCYTVDKVVITIPVPALLQNEILDSALIGEVIPKEVFENMKRVEYGRNGKLYLFFKRPFWQYAFADLYTSKYRLWDNDDRNQSWTKKSTLHSVTVFLGGSNVDLLQDPERLKNLVLADLQKFFGERVNVQNEFAGFTPAPLYHEDPNACGAYAGFERPGAEPIDWSLLVPTSFSGLYFAGATITKFSDEAPNEEVGFMGGAVRAGLQVAKDIFEH